MEKQFNPNVYARINSNNVTCRLCGGDRSIARRQQATHWQANPHKENLKDLIREEMNRSQLTIADQVDTLDGDIDVVMEEAPIYHEVLFNITPGDQEKEIQLAGHSWIIRFYMDNNLDDFSLELNEFDLNNYLVLDATVDAQIEVNHQVFSKKLSILYLRDIHPVILFHHLNLVEGDAVTLRLHIVIHRHELIPRIVHNEDIPEPAKPKRGRPVEYVNYNNLTTKLLLALFHNNRGRPFSARLLQQIIDIIKHEGFDPADAPPTEYLALRCDSFFLDCIPLSTLEFEDTDEVVRYCDPEKILEYVLQNPSFTDGWIGAWNEDETIDHPSTSDGWKIIQDHFQGVLNTNNALLVMVALWIDGFVGETSRNKSYTTISMTFANFPNSLACRHRSRFNIANIPPSLKAYKMEFVEKVIVPFLSKLEKKELAPVEFRGEPKLPVGALYTVKGDHISKLELAGIVAPSGKSSSFYTTTPSALFADLDTEQRALRDPGDAYDIILRINTLPATERTAVIQQTGYNGFKSPFWSLPLMAKNFFQRFGVCELHLLFIGIIKTNAKYFGFDLSMEERIELNAIMRKNLPAKGYVRITMTIFKEDSNKKICSMKGDMWLTFAAQSIILFKRHYSEKRQNDKYRLWKIIMNGVITVVTRKWKRQELEPDGELARLIRTMQEAMLELFPEQKWSFPNFESLYALPSQIKFLGPLHFQSTARDEEMNRRRRQILQVSNGRDQANFLTQVVEKVRAASELMIENNDGQHVNWQRLMSHNKQKVTFDDYDLILPNEPKLLQLELPDLPRLRSLIRSLEGNENAAIGTITAYSVLGFHWQDQKIMSDPDDDNADNARIKDLGLIINYEDRNITGLLTHVFVIHVAVEMDTERRFYALPLISLHPITIKQADQHFSVREGTYRRDVEFYPLGWNTCTVTGLVKVVQNGQNLFVWDYLV